MWEGWLLQSSLPQAHFLFPTAGMWEKLVTSMWLPVPMLMPILCPCLCPCPCPCPCPPHVPALWSLGMQLTWAWGLDSPLQCTTQRIARIMWFLFTK